MLSLTDDQAKALDKICKWFEVDGPRDHYLTLGGYAGTGKTTLIKWLAEELKLTDRVAYLAYTGKACEVLRRKEIFPVQTIHSYVYVTRYDELSGKFIHRLRTDWATEKLLVIDEASMVPETLFKALMSIPGNFKVLFVGDHGQLPPINSTLNLMKAPEIRLETVLRQAAENPIIRLSVMVREGRLDFPKEDLVGKMGYTFTRGNEFKEDLQAALNEYFRNSVIICSTNQARVKTNKTIRRRLFSEAAAELTCFHPNERIMFLENHQREFVFNGQMASVIDAEEYDVNNKRILVQFDGEEKTAKSIKDFYDHESERTDCLKVVNIKALYSEKPTPSFALAKQMELRKGALGPNVDYGYCITCHKAQGSEFDVVFVRLSTRDRYIWKENYAKWLYTAVTRASRRLHFV